MDLGLGEHYNVTFTNPDVLKYAESFGANGYRITSAGELLPTPRTALGEEGVSIIACPVDYSENLVLRLEPPAPVRRILLTRMADHPATPTAAAFTTILQTCRPLSEGTTPWGTPRRAVPR